MVVTSKQEHISVDTIIVLKCIEAEYLLHHPVNADDEMLKAAQELTDMGVKAVRVRVELVDGNAVDAAYRFRGFARDKARLLS